MYTLNANMAESRHEERNKNFELLSRNVIVTHDNSSYGKMMKHVLSTQPSTTSKTAIVSPSPTKRKTPTRAAAKNTLISTNTTCPTVATAEGKMNIKCHENLTFSMNMPSAHANAYAVNETIHAYVVFV